MRTSIVYRCFDGNNQRAFAPRAPRAVASRCIQRAEPAGKKIAERHANSPDIDERYEDGNSAQDGNSIQEQEPGKKLVWGK